MKQALIANGFRLFGLTRLHRLAPSSLRGIGAILMFHHVRPASTERFRPNSLLEITPAFLEALLIRLRALGYDIITLDAAVDRLRTGCGSDVRPFAVLTFDDGYRDNAVHALPVLERHGAPFTLYVTPGFAERTAHLWWLDLEEAIRCSEAVDVEIAGERCALPTRDATEKQAAWDAIYPRLRRVDEAQLLYAVGRLASAAGLDRRATVARHCMDWREIAELAANPLATIGAHTMTHPRLARVGADTMRREIEDSRASIEARLGRSVRHFAYPVGDPTSAGPREFDAVRRLGFASAVTTRPGLVFPDHAAHLAALPRLSINGNWQSLANVEVLLSGAAFALWNRGRRVNAA